MLGRHQTTGDLDSELPVKTNTCNGRAALPSTSKVGIGMKGILAVFVIIRWDLQRFPAYLKAIIHKRAPQSVPVLALLQDRQSVGIPHRPYWCGSWRTCGSHRRQCRRSERHQSKNRRCPETKRNRSRCSGRHTDTGKSSGRMGSGSRTVVRREVGTGA